MKYKRYTKIRIERFIITGFLSLILAGTLLIWIFNNIGNDHISLMDALFTSTSAVCVTGLTVVDTSTDLNLPSQSVVMILFQLGGLGIMTAATAMIMLLRQRIGLRGQLLFSGGIGLDSYSDAAKLLLYVIKFTFLFEVLGAIPLYFSFSGEYPPLQALYHSVFNSISAFCNAGFSSLNGGLQNYSSTLTVPGTVMGLIFLGGIGFIPLVNLVGFLKDRDRNRINYHTALVFILSFFLIIFGCLFIISFEWGRALKEFSPLYKVWNSLFLSVTARTAGFNTINTASLSSFSAFIVCILMIIGASPGSTGGGMKTTTFGLLVISTSGYLSRNNKAVLWHRSIPPEDVTRALSVAVIYIGTILFTVLLLSFTEIFPFKAVVFEVISALGTVGLTMGITPFLSPEGKLLIIILMFWGRIGVLTLLYGMMTRDRSKGDINYPDVTIPLG